MDLLSSISPWNWALKLSRVTWILLTMRGSSTVIKLKKKKNIIRDKSFLQHFIMESKCLIQALPGDMSIFQSCVCGPTWINPFLDHFPQDQLSLLHPTLPAEPIHNYIRCNDIKQQTFFHLIHPKKSFVHMIFSYKTINKGAKWNAIWSNSFCNQPAQELISLLIHQLTSSSLV